jgi:hypothetical protein
MATHIIDQNNKKILFSTNFSLLNMKPVSKAMMMTASS